MKIFWAVISIVSLFIGFDCSGKVLKVSDVWARASYPGATTTTLYLTIENKTGEEDTLTGITTFIADTATMEQSTTAPDGSVQVQELKILTIPAGEKKMFQPHQTYIVLKGLQKPLAAGDDFKLKLIFSKEGVVDKNVHVQSPTSVLYDGG